MDIEFNQPCQVGNELAYIEDAIARGKTSGNGFYTEQCHDFFSNRYGFSKCLLTTSCTDALEMCALLLDIQPGDEIIAPSFTFVSTVNAFVIHGAKVVFADSEASHPNIDAQGIEELITDKTKAIVVVHYAGMACDMDEILSVAQKHDVPVIEDAAQGIDAYYKEQPLGSLGSLATFSFHETKNISSGEGGMLVINEPKYQHRSNLIWEKGTNRTDFKRGLVDKYEWVDKGSSFLPSEFNAAYLYGQLECVDQIQDKRVTIWNHYYNKLEELEQKGFISRPIMPSYATQNGHLFYVLCRSKEERSELIAYLYDKSIRAVFHYLPLHLSEYYKSKHDGRSLPNAKRFADRLLRLPLYYDLTSDQQDKVISAIYDFYGQVEE